jgi:hypothetical protein
MARGLFESAAADPAVTSRPPEDGGYRAVAGTAIAAVVAAVLSPLGFLDWSLLAVPLAAIALGVVACRTIRARPDVFVGLRLALAAIAMSVVSLAGGIVWLSLAYAAELPPGHERIHYGLLQPMAGDPPGTIPETAREIDGHDVLLKGYMYPGKQQHEIVQFLLVRDQGDCCFGGNPKITDRVLVQLRDPARPRGIDFSARQVKVAGRFVIRPTGSAGLDGGVLYHLEDARVR